MATSIVNTAAKANMKSHALITDMNQVLGLTAGNALEVDEVVRYLRNEQREARLDDLVLGLCAEMLVITELETDRDVARQRCDDAVTSGRAAEVFGAMCTALGGPADFMDNSDAYLAKAPVVKPIHADGYLTAVDARAIGNAIIELGGGRRRVGEPLDLSVGFSSVAPIGSKLGADTPLAFVHAASEDAAALAAKNLLAACETGDEPPPAAPVIYEILTGEA
jgi:thymidine phosphorylase